jgi:hypothetical protein
MEDGMQLGRVVSIGVPLAAVLAASMLASPVAAQTAKGKPSAAGKSWTLPRTADGAPDLQGVWANNNATPLQRPKELAGKPLLNDQELAALKAKAAQLFAGDGDAAFGDSVYVAAVTNADKFVSRDGKTGDYNQFWLVDRDWDNRTSLITDPADGRIPELTPDAQARASARRGIRVTAEGGLEGGRSDSWEDRSLSERCVTFGTPRISAAYNSYYQIFQSKDYVVIGMETIHDARVIPLDNRPHVSSGVRQWLGDSRGHWEGDTLVVDTANFSEKSNFQGARDGLHVVERFTRVGPNTVNYEMTISDPATWTRPWTLMIPLRHSNDEIYEYACHEGNSGMVGILAGARAQERAAAEATKKGSN